VSHTASDFSTDAAYERGSDCAKRAAACALDYRYAAAIVLYRNAVADFRESTFRTAPERIAFCESEIARLDGLVKQGGSR
jgi:hypothetical protein